MHTLLDSTISLGPVPCPCCGCHLVDTFTCTCHEHCVITCRNCGRFTAPRLGPTEHVEMSFADVRCEAGAVDHDHSAEEKRTRIHEGYAKYRAKMDAGLVRRVRPVEDET